MSDTPWPADHVERWPIGNLTPYARNARTHSDEQVAKIAASIREWGWTNPVLVDESGTLIAGHGRVLAAQRLGMAEVPVMVARGWSDAQRRAYVLADNRLALDAGWDEDMLRAELEALDDDGFAVELIGFSQEEIDALLAEVEGEGDGELAATGDPEDVPEVRPEPVSSSGDVWVCGEHRVMCGSSLDLQQMEVLMNGACASLWLTDPPYNIAYQGKTSDALTIENDSMSSENFRTFLRDAYVTANAVLHPASSFYIWHADTEGYNFRGAALDMGWNIRQALVWVKSALVLGRQDYQWRHEPCLYGWTKGSPHYWGSDRKQTTVLEFDRPSRNGEHPTMKPVALFVYQMENSSRPGDVVLDSFGGSGTTMVAAEQIKRKARLMEIDPKYVDVIVRRWQGLTGKVATLEATGQPFAEVEAERLPQVR